MLPFLALAVLQAAPPVMPTSEPEPTEDVVVVGVRPRKCRLSMAEKDLSWGQVDNFARQYGVGRPIRVLAPASLDHKCMVKIMFRLANRGFKYVQFVDPAAPPSAPAAAPPPR